jgi:hypothetical protein
LVCVKETSWLARSGDPTQEKAGFGRGAGEKSGAKYRPQKITGAALRTWVWATGINTKPALSYAPTVSKASVRGSGLRPCLSASVEEPS